MDASVRSSGRHRSVPVRPQPLNDAVYRLWASLQWLGGEWPGCEGSPELAERAVLDLSPERKV